MKLDSKGFSDLHRREGLRFSPYLVATSFAFKVDKMVKSKVTQNQYNSLVSVAYNIGLEGFRTSTFLRLVNANPNDHNIASAIMMWVKDIELVPRRCDEVIGYFSAR